MLAHVTRNTAESQQDLKAAGAKLTNSLTTEQMMDYAYSPQSTPLNPSQSPVSSEYSSEYDNGYS